MKDFKRILSTEAFSYIRDTSKISFRYGKHMATYVSAFTMIMKTCKGRDKICSVIQYIADFYYNCNKYFQCAPIFLKYFVHRSNNSPHHMTKTQQKLSLTFNRDVCI